MPIEPIYQKSVTKGSSSSLRLKVGDRFDSGSLYLKSFNVKTSKTVTPHFVADGVHNEQVATSSSPVSSTFTGTIWVKNMVSICTELGVSSLSALDASKETITLIFVLSGENGEKSTMWQIDGANFSEGGDVSMDVEDTNIMASFGGSGQVTLSQF